MDSLQQTAPLPRKPPPVVYWLAAGVAVVLVSGLIALVINSGPARIEAATVARGYDDAAGAIGAGTNFSPQDNPLHCVVSLVRASKGTRVKLTWTAVEAGGQQNYKLLDREVELNGNQSTVDAYIQLPDPWPAGTYKVDIYLDGRLDRTLNFTITGADRTGSGQNFWMI